MSKTRVTILSTILLTALALSAQAELSDMALGNDGNLHSLQAGTYETLFPGGDDLDARVPVLMLEIGAPGAADGDVDRLLVPGTGDSRVESQPMLFYEPEAGVTYLLWRSSAPLGGSFRLDFATWDGEWSEVRSVDGGEGAELQDPVLIAHTRDAFHIELAGESWSSNRSIIHLLYHNSEGVAQYLPLVFDEGAFLDWQASFDLGTSFFRTPEGGSAPPALTAGLENALSMEPAGDGRSVLVTFANPESRRIGALELRARSLDLDALGDYIQDQIAEHGDLYDPTNPTPFADKIRAEIIFIGSRIELHPGIVDFVSQEIREWLNASGGDYGPGDLEDMGADARLLAIQLSGSVSGSVILDPVSGGQIPEIPIGVFLEELENIARVTELVDFRILADLPAPAISDGITAIFPARGSDDLLVGWKPTGEARIYYVESRGDHTGTWSEPGAMDLGEGLNVEQAISLLKRKVR